MGNSGYSETAKNLIIKGCYNDNFNNVKNGIEYGVPYKKKLPFAYSVLLLVSYKHSDTFRKYLNLFNDDIGYINKINEPIHIGSSIYEDGIARITLSIGNKSEKLIQKYYLNYEHIYTINAKEIKGTDIKDYLYFLILKLENIIMRRYQKYFRKNQKSNLKHHIRSILNNINLLKDRIIKNENENENDDNIDSNLCCICMTNNKDFALYPCGHKCLCEICKDCVDFCPICRRKITLKLKIYET